jgi:prolyl-tRNA editing enzyme YbaK/EbsC (Cys-tRNA(Pro) deacylase)
MKTASEKSYVMLVLPGDRKLDNKKVKDILGTKSYSFADPDELARVTSGVERGGVPPWGHLFGIPVYVDQSLFEHEKIIFNAGDRKFSVAMKSEDYRIIVNPNTTICTI